MLVYITGVSLVRKDSNRTDIYIYICCPYVKYIYIEAIWLHSVSNFWIIDKGQKEILSINRNSSISFYA